MMLGSSATRHQPSFTSTSVRDASAANQSCSRTAASAALRVLAVCVVLLLTCSSASAQASNNNLFGGGPRHLCIFLFSTHAYASQSREAQITALASTALPGLVDPGHCGMHMPSHPCWESPLVDRRPLVLQALHCLPCQCLESAQCAAKVSHHRSIRMLYPENAHDFGKLILPWTSHGTLRAPKHAYVLAAGLFGGLLGASTAAPAVVRVPPAAPLFSAPALGSATARLTPSVRRECVISVYACPSSLWKALLDKVFTPSALNQGA